MIKSCICDADRHISCSFAMRQVGIRLLTVSLCAGGVSVSCVKNGKPSLQGMICSRAILLGLQDQIKEHQVPMMMVYVHKMQSRFR